MNSFKETVLEIDLSALTHNFKVIKSYLKPEKKLLAVVKAFAYGSDAAIISKHLETLNVDYFAVAYVSEGIALRKAGITKPILVLHCQPLNFRDLIAYCLEPSLYSFRVLNEFISVAEKNGLKDYPIHLKFNTGLNRLGFSQNQTKEVFNQLKETNTIKTISLFSHLAASEDLNEASFTKQQIEAFNSITLAYKNTFGQLPMLHLCNTSGIFNYPETHFDMVRSGIGLYGFGNDLKYDNQLKPIACLKTCISQIHHLEAGDSLGYNRAFIANKATKTATLPVGHADGLHRSYGKHRGFVYINNERAPIIGNVCMDMIMVDITHINCNEGDEVIIFDEKHTAKALAEHNETISYELITSVSQRVKRIYKN